MHRQVNNCSMKVAGVVVESEKTFPYQIKKKGVQASAKTHRGEDAQANPVGAPQRLLLHVAHILQRPERTVNHMSETHAQSEENKKGWGADRGGEGQSERRYESESVQNRGYIKGVGEGK